MSSRVSRNSRRANRDYDRESGMSRTAGKKKSPKKEEIFSSASEQEQSDSEPEIAKARKRIVKKPYKEDARRRVVHDPTDDEEEEEEVPRNKKDKTSKALVSQTKRQEDEAPSSVTPFSSLFVALDVFGFSSPAHHEYSTFAVSFFGLFSLLHGIEIALNGNSRVNAFVGSYFSLAPRIYYAYMGIYHLLRAREASGLQLGTIERRVLRRLEKEFPLESCPIVAPLIPWFLSVGSFKPSDNMYSWIVPSLPTFTANDTIHRGQNGSQYYFPAVPHMLAFFRTLANINGNSHRQHFSNGGYIIPVQNDGNGTAVAWLNHDWSTDGTTAMPVQHHIPFSRPGLSYALPESNEYLSVPRRLDWKRYQLPNITHTTVVDDLEKYLFMDGGKSLQWLKSLRAQAIAQCKFFKGSANLSQISPTSSATPTVIVQLESPSAAPAAKIAYEQIDNSYVNVPFHGHTCSGQITETEMKLALLTRPIIEVEATTNLFPANFQHATLDITGPWYRHSAADSTYTGGIRNRWRKTNDAPQDVYDDLETRIRLDMYRAEGTDPAPMVIVE